MLIWRKLKQHPKQGLPLAKLVTELPGAMMLDVLRNLESMERDGSAIKGFGSFMAGPTAPKNATESAGTSILAVAEQPEEVQEAPVGRMDTLPLIERDGEVRRYIIQTGAVNRLSISRGLGISLSDTDQSLVRLVRDGEVIRRVNTRTGGVLFQVPPMGMVGPPGTGSNPTPQPDLAERPMRKSRPSPRDVFKARRDALTAMLGTVGPMRVREVRDRMEIPKGTMSGFVQRVTKGDTPRVVLLPDHNPKSRTKWLMLPSQVADYESGRADPPVTVEQPDDSEPTVPAVPEEPETTPEIEPRGPYAPLVPVADDPIGYPVDEFMGFLDDRMRYHLRREEATEARAVVLTWDAFRDHVKRK